MLPTTPVTTASSGLGPHQQDAATHTNNEVSSAKRKAPDESPNNEKEDTSPVKRLKHDYSDDIFTVLVGESETKFCVHEAILCKSSGFLQSACSRNWKEGQERLIKLPQADVEAFIVYTHWLYTGKVKISLMTPATGESPPPFLSLGKLWVLGNFLSDDAFFNVSIDCMLLEVEGDPDHIPPGILQYLWNLTGPESNLRRLMLDLAVTKPAPTEEFEVDQELYPQEVIVELARKFIAKERRGACPTFDDRCAYHAHAEGEEKCW